MKKLLFLLLVSASFLLCGAPYETMLALQILKREGKKESCVMESFMRSSAGEKAELRVLNTVELREIGVKTDATLAPGPKGTVRVKADSFFGIPDEGAFLAPGMEAQNADLSFALSRFFPGKRVFPAGALTTPDGKLFVPLVFPEIRHQDPVSPVPGTGKCEISFLKIKRTELLKKVPGFSFRDPDRAAGSLAEDPACRKWLLPHRPFRTEVSREIFCRGKGGVPSRNTGSRISVAAAGEGGLKIEFSDVRLAGTRLSGHSELPGKTVDFPVFETVFYRTTLKRPRSGKWIVLAAFSSFSAGKKTLFEEKTKAVPEVLLIFFRSSY